MNERKFFGLTMAGIIVLVLLIASFTFGVSMYKEKDDRIFTTVTDREYNSILARRFPYNAAILGSSMCQGFRCSDFDREFGCQALKMTCSAANFAEVKFMAEYASRFQKLDYVIFDLRCVFLGFEQTLDNMPLESYSDRVIWYRLKKSFSINALMAEWEFFSKRIRGKVKYVSRDEIYDWNKKHPCGEKYFAREILFKERYPYRTDAAYRDLCATTLDTYVIPLLQELPETEFHIFFPPFSMMFYMGLDPAEYIALKQMVIDRLLPMKNLVLHDFEIACPIMENFENYKDLTHYSGKISSRMVTAMKTREFQLTPENKEDHLRKLQSQIASFDYQKEFDRLKQTYRK